MCIRDRDKVALVTGAAGGIGGAIVERLSQHGVHVVVSDIDESGMALAKSVGGTFFKADLAQSADVITLARKALSMTGCVDILVNNAGTQHVAPIEDFPESTWAKMVQIMMIAPFQLTKHL